MMSKKNTKRVAVLFHIVGFRQGGIESALIEWLRIFDRSRFDVTLSVMFNTPWFEKRYRARLPHDVKLEFLVDKPWLGHLEARRSENKLGKLGRACRGIVNSTIALPYARKRITALAKKHDVLIDFDLSLRRWVGRLEIASGGVSHFSFLARWGHQPRKAKRLAPQLFAYDRIVALTQQMADEAPQLFGNALAHPFVLPNAVDIDSIRRRAHVKDAPRAPVRGPYIVSVARLDEHQKDHRTLIEAYAQLLKKRRVDEDLVLAGDGKDRQSLEACAKSLGVGERVHFVGHVDNPHALIAGARLFVLSSRYEGMPMGLVEALAHGRPVVATDCPTGPREMLDEGRAGLLVPVGDVPAMAAALARVVTDDALHASLCAAALARAEHYGIEASNERLAACVASLLDA
jgi:glycosyltransferase involved in cell wall biosynthesis